MSSFPYLAPTTPPTPVVEDMIIWFAPPQIRAQLMFDYHDQDSTMMADLCDQVRQMIRTWTPSTTLHEQYAMRARVLDWMVWQVVTSLDEDLAATYTEDCLEPWAIDISTLPSYQLRYPTSIPALPAPVTVDWTERHN